MRSLSEDKASKSVCPRHIAIIMDGNGRWAEARGWPRSAGHRAGIEALRKTVRACRDHGVIGLTVFSFSTENWKRPEGEIEALFELMRHYVRTDLERLIADDVKIRVIGSRRGLSPDMVALIEIVEQRSDHCSGFDLVIAFNYGGRAEIVEAARALAVQVGEGTASPDKIDEQIFARQLWSACVPEPDLIIRTGGEFRLSNFLLWGAAYAELVFMDVCWPDFEEKHLFAAIETYIGRDRRFGTVSYRGAGSA